MTETDWLGCDSPAAMLESLRGRSSGRKFRLFACGCCRRLWPQLGGHARAAVETAERYADGLVGLAELQQARRELQAATVNITSGDARLTTDAADVVTVPEFGAAEALLVSAVVASLDAQGPAAGRAAQCDLLHDAFGNPFRAVTFEPAWRSPQARELAETLYQRSAFDHLPELACALERAGCRHADVLSHCRDGRAHARGCWVVDAVLERQ